MVTEQLLSLAECRSQLLDEWGGKTPALITLKRWSQAGLLDSAKRTPPTGRRVKFAYEALAARVRDISRNRTPPSETAASPTLAVEAGGSPSRQDLANPNAATPAAEIPEPAAAPPVESGGLDLIQARLGTHLAEALQPVLSAILEPLLRDALAATQKQLTDGLINLRSIERNLMLRFDSENQLLRSKVAELKQENDRLRQQSSSIDMARLQMTLARLTEKIDSLRGEGS